MVFRSVNTVSKVGVGGFWSQTQNRTRLPSILPSGTTTVDSPWNCGYAAKLFSTSENIKNYLRRDCKNVEASVHTRIDAGVACFRCLSTGQQVGWREHSTSSSGRDDESIFDVRYSLRNLPSLVARFRRRLCASHGREHRACLRHALFVSGRIFPILCQVSSPQATLLQWADFNLSPPQTVGEPGR